MDRLESNFGFRVMSFIFKLRDFFLPLKDVLKEVGIKSGFSVLDCGCGQGSYIIAATDLVGKSGKVYALDIHPLAIQKVRNIAVKRRLEHLETIQPDCKTGLPDDSIDVVLLYDTFHNLSDPYGVLGELHRVLKPKGILSFSDHHMKENEILFGVTFGGLFKLLKKGEVKLSEPLSQSSLLLPCYPFP
jgi:ubiquinone/menaquinone biosynthesis C-methylase UbiE